MSYSFLSSLFSFYTLYFFRFLLNVSTPATTQHITKNGQIPIYMNNFLNQEHQNYTALFGSIHNLQHIYVSISSVFLMSLDRNYFCNLSQCTLYSRKNDFFLHLNLNSTFFYFFLFIFGRFIYEMDQ